MSKLAAAFTQRQLPRRDSDSTVSSAEERNNRGEIRRFEEPVTRSPLNNDSNFVFNTCKDVRVGENITNVYMSNLAQDIKNPAFTLNDKNVTRKDKLSFIFAQQWFWCLIFLAVSTIGFVTMLVLVLVIKSQQTSYDMLSRKVWEALDAKLNLLDELSLPVIRIIVTHTNSESCYNQTECIDIVRELQLKYIDDLGDIPYNFLIGNDGSIYEGRGFEFEGVVPGNFSSSYNGLVIAFIGTYVDELLSQLQINIFNEFVSRSIRQDLISNDVNLLLADQLVSSEPFANGLYEMLMNRTDFYGLEKIFVRAEWEAVPPNAPTKVTHIPEVVQIARLIISCSSLVTCITKIFDEQATHMDTYSDINFNFMISQFGIFEGRGWDWKPEQKQGDELQLYDAMFFAFVGEMPTAGTEDYVKFKNELLTKLKKFIKDGIIIGKIESDYELDCDHNILCETN